MDLILHESKITLSPGKNKCPDFIFLKHKNLIDLLKKGKLSVELEDSDRPEIKAMIINTKKDSKSVVKDSENSNSSIDWSIRGQFFDYSGYAKVNRSLVNCLKEWTKVAIDPIDSNNKSLTEQDLQCLNGIPIANRAKNKIDSIVPSSAYASHGRFNNKILYTTLETNTVNKDVIGILDMYDEIWTTSTFCKQAFDECGIKKKILVVPGAIDIDEFIDIKPINITSQTKSFVFMSVFNWNYRKGADALIRAYCQAFSGSDDVSLILVCRKKRISGPASGVRDEIEKEIAKSSSSNPPHIMRVTKEINEIQLAELYRSCNAFVLPSRGEGYGLPYLEASLCGLPVIGTKVSAIKDILSSDNSLLVDIDSIKKVPSNATGCYFWDGHLMADLTSNAFIDRLADSMKDMIKNYQLYVEKNKVLKRNTCNSSSSEAIFNIIKDKIH
jgi:glycosyltransferase involved in cell wall biosynthesis